MERSVITIVGKDTPGIIAKSSAFLYQHNVNILEITQTIISGMFNMMMIVDTATADIPFLEFSRSITELGKEIGVEIRCQKEEIFDMMHRI